MNPRGFREPAAISVLQRRGPARYFHIDPEPVFDGIRSERQLMEQLSYNLLHRWFVGLSPDDPIWNFTKNRDRLLARHTLKAEPRADPKHGAVTPSLRELLKNSR